MTKKSTVITISVTLGVTIAALLVAVIIFISTTNTYANQLENVYKRSYYELTSNINDIEVDISKLIATTDVDAQKEVLTDIFNTCTLATTNISNIPVSSGNIKDVTNYINKLSGFSYSLITKINNKVDFSETDISSVYELHTHALNLLYKLDEFNNSMSFNYSFVKKMKFDDENTGLSQTFGNIQTTSSKVPTLIYDGPFAESVLKPDIKGLPTNKITKEDGLAIINEKLAMYNLVEVKYDTQTTGLFTTFNYNVKTPELDMYVQLTELGGTILEITSRGDGGDKELNESESQTLAKTFAKSLGYEDMYSVWSTKSGGVVYVNLAPIVNRVIYYPDLIKVKVDTSLGLVTGWEAKNYSYNHIERNLATPKLTLAQAQQKISSHLTITERNIALIPIQYGQEKLSYEFICTWKNYTYYVYIDVDTGKELNILRVLKTENGNLII